MKLYQFVRAIQDVIGVGNAFGLIYQIDSGDYGRAALSFVCMLATASWYLPKPPKKEK